MNLNLMNNEYVGVVGNIVSSKNISFATRMSNNKVCIYLADKNLVEEFHDIRLKLLINPSTFTNLKYLVQLNEI